MLESKGMCFQNKEQAQRYLAQISYYRLSGYWYPFQKRTANGTVTNAFVSNTQFDDAITLYEFDRQLRQLLLDGIERIEVAIRTQFTYHIGHTYGPFGHTKALNFHPKFEHEQWLRKLNAEVMRSKDEFIHHYKNKYDGFPTIPIWMLTEVMSLGSLSLGYQGLLNDQKQGVEDKKAIASYFKIHHKRLGNWLHSLTYIRNVCAHHSRLWNRELSICPDRTKEQSWSPPITPRNDRVFYILLIIQQLLKNIKSSHDWHQRVENLLCPIAQHDNWRIAMGIPERWKEHPLWGTR